MLCSNCKKQKLSTQVDYVNVTASNRCSSCGGPLSEEKEIKQVNDEEQGSHILLYFIVLMIFVLLMIAASLFLIFGKGVDIPPEALENPEYGLPETD